MGKVSITKRKAKELDYMGMINLPAGCIVEVVKTPKTTSIFRGLLYMRIKGMGAHSLLDLGIGQPLLEDISDWKFEKIEGTIQIEL